MKESANFSQNSVVKIAFCPNFVKQVTTLLCV